MSSPRLLTPAEATELLDVSADRLSRWARNGLIRRRQVGFGHGRYYEKDILALAAELSRDTVSIKWLARQANAGRTTIYSEIRRGCLVARQPITGYSNQPWVVDRADAERWLKLWLTSAPEGYEPSHEWH